MNHERYSFTECIIVYLICAAVNFSYFLYQSSGKVWISFPVSVFFTVYMILYAYRKKSTLTGMLGLIILFLGIAGFFAAKYDLLADWLIIPAAVFAAPFSGMGCFAKNELFWALFSVFGAALSVLSFLSHSKKP